MNSVAVIAGGPYRCAQGSFQQAVGPCMKGEGIDVAALHAAGLG